MRKAVFLDRDGVLNHAVVKNGKPFPPQSVDELTIPEDALQVLTELRSLGYLLIGATNQPDVARGTTTQEAVAAINKELLKLLPLDTIEVCYHDDRDNCECRKPKAGLLKTAASSYQIDLSESYMIGDRWKDVEAGRQAGCKTIFLDLQYQELYKGAAADFTAATLTQAKNWIINIG